MDLMLRRRMMQNSFGEVRFHWDYTMGMPSGWLELDLRQNSSAAISMDGLELTCGSNWAAASIFPTQSTQNIVDGKSFALVINFAKEIVNDSTSGAHAQELRIPNLSNYNLAYVQTGGARRGQYVRRQSAQNTPTYGPNVGNAKTITILYNRGNQKFQHLFDSVLVLDAVIDNTKPLGYLLVIHGGANFTETISSIDFTIY